MKIRQKLIDKIITDIGSEIWFMDEIDQNIKICRPTLTWQHRTAGRFIWYWNINGYLVGSSEGMRDLLKSKKLVLYKPTWGDFEISSS